MNLGKKIEAVAHLLNDLMDEAEGVIHTSGRSNLEKVIRKMGAS